MAIRPYWKGYLKLSLVTCPVEMMPATSNSEKVRFHTLNRNTQNRVVSQYVDAVTGKPVNEDDEAKGYERGEGEYVLLDDDDLENVAIDSTKTIDIEIFSPRENIGWIWLDTPYYLTPSDPVGEEAFSVIREAMKAENKVGISRLVLSRRVRAVMLEPRGRGIVLWTLRYGDEVRDEDVYFERIGDENAASDALPLIEKFIKRSCFRSGTETFAGYNPSQEEVPEETRKSQVERVRGRAIWWQRHQYNGRPAELTEKRNQKDEMRKGANKMAQKRNPWSDPDLVREKDAKDPSQVEPRDHQEKPTHEQSNAPGNPNVKVPKEPYPDRTQD